MWSAVYKRTYGKDYKFKAGYDSDVRLGWASLWVKPQTFTFFSLFSDLSYDRDLWHIDRPLLRNST